MFFVSGDAATSFLNASGDPFSSPMRWAKRSKLSERATAVGTRTIILREISPLATPLAKGIRCELINTKKNLVLNLCVVGERLHGGRDDEIYVEPQFSLRSRASTESRSDIRFFIHDG